MKINIEKLILSADIMAWAIIQPYMSIWIRDAVRYWCLEYLIKSYTLEQWTPIQKADVLQIMVENKYTPKKIKKTKYVKNILSPTKK